MPRARRKRQVKDARVSITDVRRLRYFGLVADSLKPLATEAERELASLLSDKGADVTEAERTLLEDTARLGLLLRAEFARYLQDQDQQAAVRVTALAGQRRSNLQAVGLERRARTVTVGGTEIEAETAGPRSPHFIPTEEEMRQIAALAEVAGDLR